MNFAIEIGPNLVKLLSYIGTFRIQELENGSFWDRVDASGEGGVPHSFSLLLPILPPGCQRQPAAVLPNPDRREIITWKKVIM